MKISVILIFIACLQSGARGYSQQISLSFTDAPLEKVLKEIQRQTSFGFIYSKETIDRSLPVTVTAKNETVENVLKICFANQPLSFTIEEKFVIIKTETAKIVQKGLINLRGKVVNENDEPIPAVTVSIKGSARITITDSNGEFTLTGLDPGVTLIISGAEILGKEIRLNDETFILIKVKTKVSELDQLMVIAYGQTTKRFNTGSISKVTAEDIAKQAVSNPLAALEGRVPGLVVSSTSGVPGASYNIQIRGQNSLNPDPNSIFVNPRDQPLFIIDGIPFAAQNSNINLFQSLASPGANNIYGNPYAGISPFSVINPGDIESIEVLRDADATAIYGSKAANGVILITTKKGKPGATTGSLNIYSGLSQVTRTMPLLNTRDYITMRREAFNNDGATPNLTYGNRAYAPDLLSFDTTRDMDWKNYFLGGTAATTNADASLSGGSENTRFLFGTGYHHETYIFPGDFSSSRISVNGGFHHHSINNRFLLEFSANYSYNTNNSAGSASLLQAFTLPPDYPALIKADGGINWEYNGAELRDNPMSFIKQKYKADIHSLVSNVLMSYQLFPGMLIRTSFGYNTLRGSEISQVPQAALNPYEERISYANFGANNFETWIVEPMAEYKKNLGKAKLTLLAGTTFQQNTNSQAVSTGYNYPDDALLGSLSAAADKTISDMYIRYKYTAFFGRINYTYKARYILNLNGRRDGSSRFGPGKQFGNFGSAGISWLFSEEGYFKKFSQLLSFGKLRASYGTTGNDNIGDYQYQTLWSPATGNALQGSRGYIPQNLYNPDFSWSTTKKFEAALEMGFLKDRLFAEITWFCNRSGNQLVTYRVPSQTGFTGVTANFPAVIQNSGWEIQLNTVNIRKSHFQWRTSFNLTIPRNKLVSFPGIETSSYASLYKVGQSLNLLYRFKSLGVDPVEGVYMFASKDGPTPTPTRVDDYFVSGNLDPRFYGGLGNAVSWKGFQLDLFAEFRKQTGANYLQQINNLPPGRMFNQPSAVLGRWQSSGDLSAIEKFTSTSRSVTSKAATSFTTSDAAYSDASYIRLKTVSVSYSIDTKILRHIKMQACRVFVNGQNLFVITHYKGNDPETQSFYSLPPLRTLVAGIQFTF